MTKSSNRNTPVESIVGSEVQDTSEPHLLFVGVITRSHGVKGEVWVKIIDKSDRFIDGQISEILLGADHVPYALELSLIHI